MDAASEIIYNDSLANATSADITSRLADRFNCNELPEHLRLLIAALVSDLLTGKPSISKLRALFIGVINGGLRPADIMELIAELLKRQNRLGSPIDSSVIWSAAIALVEVVEERREGELGRLAYSLRRDPSTGLKNRSGLLEHLPPLLNRSSRLAKPLAVVVFQLIAVESQSLAETESLRSETVAAIESSIRSSDLLASISEYRLAIVCDLVSGQEAVTALIDRIRQSVAVATCNKIDLKSGVALYPFHGEDASTLLARAESALVEILASKDSISFADGTLRCRKSVSPKLQVVLDYQPIFDLEAGRPIRLEALARLATLTEVIQPDSFVSYLDRQGRMELLEQVQSKVISDLKQGPQIPVAINVEPDILTEKEFVAHFIEAWNRSGLDPALLTLEVTETHQLFSLSQPALTNLSEAGFRLSLDDFGSGYASLSRVMGFPFKEIKLDKMFVLGTEIPGPGLELVAAAAEAVHALDFELVVEGIESEKAAASLLGAGIRYGQGFALSVPRRFKDAAKAEIRSFAQDEYCVLAKTLMFSRLTTRLLEIEPDTRWSSPCGLDLTGLDAVIAIHDAQHKLLMGESGAETYEQLESKLHEAVIGFRRTKGE
jgi:EAL domain-containing protein (putative c-di-GMP-specific phosphodiesterase class I)